MPQRQASPQDPRHAIRLRDNKRRYRNRQKDYIANLERRLNDLREEGVQATKEVQIAARRVVRENERLRQLLRHEKISDDVIEAWLHKEETNVDKSAAGARSSQGSSALSKPVSLPLGMDAAKLIVSAQEVDDSRSISKKACEEFPPPRPVIQNVDSEETGARRRDIPSTGCRAKETRHLPNLESASVTEKCSATTPAPCKLLTRLAANPREDITQVPIAIDKMRQGDEAEGVECARAYLMLNQFVTSEEKLDIIAVALERGCKKNEGSGGGCSVPNDVIWKAMDDLTA